MGPEERRPDVPAGWEPRIQPPAGHLHGLKLHGDTTVVWHRSLLPLMHFPGVQMLCEDHFVPAGSPRPRQSSVRRMARFDTSLSQLLDREREVYVRLTRRDG